MRGKQVSSIFLSICAHLVFPSDTATKISTGQLNLYSFRRITEGREKGAYAHDFFLKGKRSLCRKVKRQKTRVKTVQSAPSFGAMSPRQSFVDMIGANSAPFPNMLGGVANNNISFNSLLSAQAASGMGDRASLLRGLAAAGVGNMSQNMAALGGGNVDVGQSFLQQALRRELLGDVNNLRASNSSTSLISQELQNKLQEQETEIVLQRLLQQQQKDQGKEQGANDGESS